MGYQRVICAFQPHTYSRTKALFSQFVEELKLPDVTVLAEIYAAREQNDIGISSQDLAREIPSAIYCSSLEKVTDGYAGLFGPARRPDPDGGAGDIFGPGKSCWKEREHERIACIHGAPASRTPVEDRTPMRRWRTGHPL